MAVAGRATGGLDHGTRAASLVLRALGLGDMLTALPALRGLRRAMPGGRLVLAGPPGLAPLARLSGAVDDVLPAAALRPLTGLSTAPPPAVAVNLHGRGPQSHRLLQALSPGRLVAFASAEAGHDGPEWRADEHEVRRWCRLVDSSFSVPARRQPLCDPDDLDLPAAPGRPDGAEHPGGPRAVVVHPGAAFGCRRWPVDRFAAVARRVADRGLPVVVTGSAGERPLAREVARQAGLDEGQVLAGSTDVLQLAAVVSTARLVLSGDTGVAHLATAYRRPSVLLFGPTPPSRWGPPPRAQHVVLWHGGPTRDPWGERPDPALLRIGVEEAMAAVDDLLDRPA